MGQRSDDTTRACGNDDAADFVATMTVLTLVHTAAVSAAAGLPSAQVARRQVQYCNITAQSLTLQGRFSAGTQRSGLRHASVLVFFLRRSTQVQHIIAPAQASVHISNAPGQQERHART
jgi:hypothetical protein